MTKSRLHKFDPSYTWSLTEKEAYKAEPGGWCGIDRNVLIGGKGEGTKFHLRYFEINPGGNSSLEKHGHEHVVICVRGRGRAVVEDKMHDLESLDVLYIAPDAPHQLLNPHDEPFGFLCIVDAERDKPRELSKDELKKLDESSETRGKYIGYVQGD
ncbi:MAG TPA: cupin domain-containing protein [Nitrospirota bacterium]|nr:cupin domain-containing protein [Nitrospirota bacterium]